MPPRLTIPCGPAPATGRVGHPPAAPVELMSRTNRPERFISVAHADRPGRPRPMAPTDRYVRPMTPTYRSGRPMSPTAQLQRGPAR